MQLAFIAQRVQRQFPYIFWLIAQIWLSSWLALSSYRWLLHCEWIQFLQSICHEIDSIWELLGFAFCRLIACNMLQKRVYVCVVNVYLFVPIEIHFVIFTSDKIAFYFNYNARKSYNNSFSFDCLDHTEYNLRTLKSRF